MIAATPDRFRGTIQRWTVDAGPLAGRTCDHAFNEDWTLTWRVMAGADQGLAGRARRFSVQPVRAQLFLVCFATIPGEIVSATVDFSSRRFAGFHVGADYCHPVSGAFRTL